MEARFANQWYAHLRVADFQTWKDCVVTKAEESSLVAIERQWGDAVPGLVGIVNQFHSLKKRFFGDEKNREKVNDEPFCIQFYECVCSDVEESMCVRMFAACILVSTASSADAERSISFLNLIIGSLRTRLTWDAIRTHLIGREDIDPKTFPLGKVVSKWGETPRRRCTQVEKRKERKDKGLLRRKRKVMDYNHCDDGLKTILEEGEEEEREEEEEEDTSSSSSSSSGSSASDTSDADSSSSSSESSSGSSDSNSRE